MAIFDLILCPPGEIHWNGAKGRNTEFPARDILFLLFENLGNRQIGGGAL